MWRRSSMVCGLAVVLLLAAAAPAAADSGVRLRLGLFTPEGEGDLFAENADVFTGGVDDLEDVVGGIDYEHRFGEHLALLLSADLYEGKTDQAYRDFVDDRGDDIFHTTTLEIVPFTAGLRFDLAPSRSPVIPYLGGGGGVYTYRYEESGDFIDFDAGGEIFATTLTAEGAVLGYYVLAGVEVPIGPYFSFFAEGRWDRADDELGDDFEDFGTIDLSGRRVMGGLAWRF
jgi:hypothetical protein